MSGGKEQDEEFATVAANFLSTATVLRSSGTSGGSIKAVHQRSANKSHQSIEQLSEIKSKKVTKTNKKKSSNQHESIIDDLQRTILKRKGQSKIQTDFLVTRAIFFLLVKKSQIFVQISVFFNVKILVVQVENLLVISHFFAGFWGVTEENDQRSQYMMTYRLPRTVNAPIHRLTIH